MRKIFYSFFVTVALLASTSVAFAMDYAAVSSSLGHEIVQLNESTGELQRWCESTGTYCETILGSYTAMDAQGNQLCALRDDAHVICWKKTLGGFKEKDLGTANAGAEFEKLALGRNFVVTVDSNHEVFYRFFTDNTWTQYMPGTTFEQTLDAGSDWFCVYAGGVFPWRTSCFEPSTGETEEVLSYWSSALPLDDSDHVYAFLPDGYFPDTLLLRDIELGTGNSSDLFLTLFPLSMEAGGESLCVNGGLECYGQLEGSWSLFNQYPNYIVATFRNVDALILIDSAGVPNVVVP